MILNYPDLHLSAMIRQKKGERHVKMIWDDPEGPVQKDWVISNDSWNNGSNPFREFLSANKLDKVIDDLEEKKITALDLIRQVSRAVTYSSSQTLDIYFGEDMYHCEGKDFLNPDNFCIWYMSNFYKLLDLTKAEWQNFLTITLKEADKKIIDPIAPPFVERIIELFTISPIHSDFCKEVALAFKNNGENAFFVQDPREFRKDIFYAPKWLIRRAAEREKLTGKDIKPMLKPILDTDGYFTKYLMIDDGKQKNGTFWALSYKKMYKFDPTISSIFKSNLLNCEEEKHNDL